MLQTVKTSFTELLTQLRSQGVSFWEENGKLRYSAPRGLLKESDLQTLKDSKKDILALLRAESEPVAITADPGARFDPFALTDVQSAYLLGRHEAFGYGGVACHVYLELNYPQLDPERTQAAWNRLIARHDMLRAIFDQDGHQRVLESVPQMKLTCTDASGWKEREVDARLDEIRQAMGHRIYDTDQWPLFDIGLTRTPSHTVLHFSMEFLIADWTSIWLLIWEFETLYATPERRLPALELSFRDYLTAERSLKQTPAYTRDKAYWLGRIPALPPAPDLPLSRREEDTGPARFQRRSLQLDKQVWEELKKRTLKRGLTPTSVVMTAYAAVLERWSRNKRFCLNLTVLNRLPLHPQVNEIVGDFTSVSLLAVDWRAEHTFSDRARALKRQLFKDLDHPLFSGVEVLREVARRHGREAALMPVVFTSAIGLVEATQKQQLQGTIGEYGISQTPQVFIDCQAMDSAAGLQVNWDVRQGVFPQGLVDDMFHTFERLLGSLCTTNQIWESTEFVTLPARQLTQRRSINATNAPLPDHQLHRPVLAQAAATPHLPAVFDSRGCLTYGALAQQAAAVAETLKASGCGLQDRVAVVMEKCAHQVAAVLGALSAGAVYVPIDMAQPELRRLAMLEQAGVRFALTCATPRMQWPQNIKTIEVDKLKPCQGDNPIPPGDPDRPAYIIYTSGSTGQPKGVVISHRAAANTITDINRRFNVNQGDRVLGLAHLGFDLSVYDIFGLLSVGGAIVYPDVARRTDPSHWAELMATHDITLWNSVPALMQMLITYLSSERQTRLPRLRLALLSGDWIPLTLPDKLSKRVPGVQVIGLGGATEAAIWSIYHMYKGLQDDWRSIPYGRPLANQEFRILDAQMRDCPEWAPGELYIAGNGLADGYWEDAETTQKRFLQHPADGQRLYRTGDLGRYTPGGEIEFLGREDNQVKIKGHRIELGEIESILQEHPAVAAAGVVVEGSRGDSTLMGVAKTACKKERNHHAETAAFEKLVNGVDAQAAEAVHGLSRVEIASAVASLNQAVLNAMLYALLRLGLFTGGRRHSMQDILQCHGIAPEFHWLVRRWLAKLTRAGLLVAHSAHDYSCAREPDEKIVSASWEAAEPLWTPRLGSPGFTAYVRRNTEKLPELLGGRQDPVELLFPEGRLDHVRSLYVDHVMANYLNHCISRLIKRIARDMAGSTLRILEVGAGTGATTEKVLACLEGVDVDYWFTDVTTFFIPEAKNRFGQFPGIRFGIFDVDRDYRSQGLAPNSFDVVLAAGVLENARDIPASLNRLTELIGPGGWLVFTEPTDEHAWILASQAFMMTEPDDALRTQTSYLDRDEWTALLKKYGDEPILSLPEEKHKLAPLGVHLFAKRFKQDRLPVRPSELTAFLLQRLPAHMLPSHLQIVDELPLTANGKIDRRTLAKWRPKSRGRDTAAQTAEKCSDLLEAQLTRLWAQALGIDGIGRLQNFYDHGADSLIMAQVAGKLRDQFAAGPSSGQIPFDALLRQMLNHPTVAALAQFIRAHSQAAKRTPEAPSPEPQSESGNAVLTPYGGGETGPLRVVFHAGLGTMDCFRLLLGHLTSQSMGPVVGITIADTEKYCAQAPSGLIESTADAYAQRLLAGGHRQMQLIGYCLGGLIAVEVARRLVEKGIHLSDLVLIDSHPVLFDIDDDLILESLFVPNFNITLEQAGFGGANSDDIVRGFMQIIEKNDNQVPRGSSCAIGGDENLEKVGHLFQRLAALTSRERFSAYVKAVAKVTGEQMPVEMAEGLFKVYRQSFRAAYFTPPPYMGDIRFLRAREPSDFLSGGDDMTLAFWKDVCLGELEVMEIEGNHFSCIEQEPHVTGLAELISAPLMGK